MVEIIQTLPESLRPRAGQIYYEAFRRQLYERMGFTMVETHFYPLKSDWLGFSSDRVMLKTL